MDFSYFWKQQGKSEKTVFSSFKPTLYKSIVVLNKYRYKIQERLIQLTVSKNRLLKYIYQNLKIVVKTSNSFHRDSIIKFLKRSRDMSNYQNASVFESRTEIKSQRKNTPICPNLNKQNTGKNYKYQRGFSALEKERHGCLFSSKIKGRGKDYQDQFWSERRNIVTWCSDFWAPIDTNCKALSK